MEENPLNGHEPDANRAGEPGTNPAPEASSTETARRRLAERVSRNLETAPALEDLPPGAHRPKWFELDYRVWVGVGLVTAALVCLLASGLGIAWLNQRNQGAQLPPISPAAPVVAVTQASPAGPTDSAAGLAVQPSLTSATVPAAIIPTTTAAPVAQGTTPEQPQPPALAAPPTANGARLLLLYDPGSLYVLNASEQDLPLSGLAFELLDASDQVLIRVDGWYWGQIYNRFRTGFCIVAVQFGNRQALDPPECLGKHLVVRTPAEEQNRRFWVGREGASQFRVLWQEQEAGRCPVGNGPCEVRLP